MNLGEIPKNNIYKVPEGYFERLPSKIQQRIDASEEKTVLRSINEHKFWRLSAGIAASLLIFWLTWHYHLQDFSGQDILSGIADTELIAYLEQNTWSDEINEDQFFEFLLLDEGLHMEEVWRDLIELDEIEIEESTLWQFDTM